MSSIFISLSDEKLSQASSEHKFIQMISSDQISEEEFNTWLSQDYLFVIKYIHFTAFVLQNAPRQDFSILINGLSTLSDEIKWFEEKLIERNINPSEIKPLPENIIYQNWLNNLTLSMPSSYLKLLTIFYGIELCYYKAWKCVKNEKYQEFANRWSSNEFGQYINELKTAIHRESEMAKDAEKEEVIQEWNAICEHEINFWNSCISN